jgi:hypothetical protein
MSDFWDSISEGERLPERSEPQPDPRRDAPGPSTTPRAADRDLDHEDFSGSEDAVFEDLSKPKPSASSPFGEPAGEPSPKRKILIAVGVAVLLLMAIVAFAGGGSKDPKSAMVPQTAATDPDDSTPAQTTTPTAKTTTTDDSAVPAKTQPLPTKKDGSIAGKTKKKAPKDSAAHTLPVAPKQPAKDPAATDTTGHEPSSSSKSTAQQQVDKATAVLPTDKEKASAQRLMKETLTALTWLDEHHQTYVDAPTLAKRIQKRSGIPTTTTGDLKLGVIKIVRIPTNNQVIVMSPGGHGKVLIPVMKTFHLKYEPKL